MSKEAYFIGEPVEFKKGITIHPPKVREVISNRYYGLYLQVLSLSQEEIEDLFTQEGKGGEGFPTPMEFMLNNCYHNKQYETIAKEGLEFFLKTKVDFLYEQKKIIIGALDEVLAGIQNLNELITISEEEFFDFQNQIRLASSQKAIDPPKLNEHPKIRAMKAKARYRDKVKAKQNAKNGVTLFSTMASICCMGIGLTPLNIGEMSYVALNALVRQYQAKEKYQTDIDSLLAGASSKKIKPVYWIKNLED